MTKKSLSLLFLLALMLAGINAWSWSKFQSSREAAIIAEQDAIQCRHLADDMKRLRSRPTIAGSHEIELTELSRRIEQVANDAGIPVGDLVRISPEASRRLDAGVATGASDALAQDASYLEKPTSVLLSGVTLTQLTTFLFNMSTGNAAMDVREMRLSAPRQDEDGDRWSADITLTYLIYNPPDEPANLRGRSNSSAAATGQRANP
jgi:hypothetical protein